MNTTQAVSVVGSISVEQASKEYGQLAHAYAVFIGSKTEVGKQIGKSKKTVVRITRGKAHHESPEVLKSLNQVVAANTADAAIAERMEQLVQIMKGTQSS